MPATSCGLQPLYTRQRQPAKRQNSSRRGRDISTNSNNSHSRGDLVLLHLPPRSLGGAESETRRAVLMALELSLSANPRVILGVQLVAGGRDQPQSPGRSRSQRYSCTPRAQSPRRPRHQMVWCPSGQQRRTPARRGCWQSSGSPSRRGR